VLAQARGRFDAQVLSYCLMGNHCHVVLHTRQANFSLFMRHLNGVHTQRFNRRHGKVGQVFQGRFMAILVDCAAICWRFAATHSRLAWPPAGA
jgi:putative transposase